MRGDSREGLRVIDMTGIWCGTPWSHLRSDLAHHCVLWISEWPRSLVYPRFLSSVLISSGVRRIFTLLYTPMRADHAVCDISKRKTEKVSDAAQYRDMLRQEASLTAGHRVPR